MTIEAVLDVLLLLLRYRHVIQADLTLMLLAALASTRRIIHETVSRDLRQVLGFLLGDLTAARLINGMNARLMIIIHV